MKDTASAECSTIDSQRGDAGGESGRLHPEHFRRSARSRNFALGLLQRLDDCGAFLPFQFVAGKEAGIF